MDKPVILIVNDNPEVLKVNEQHLKSEFGDRFQVVIADLGGRGLKALKQFKERQVPVALLLVGQQLPEMTGVEFVKQARELFPNAKCILHTHLDTDADIRAIKKIKIDCYVLRLSESPEESLYPAVEDLLDDWQASFHSLSEDICVIDHRWSSQLHQIKSFLARNQRPFHWLNIETDKKAHRLVEKVKLAQPERSDSPQFPLLIFPDGSHLEAPTQIQVADKIGLKTHAERQFYDVIIVGAGPAGLAAGIYAASEGLSTLMIDKVAPGGQAGTTSRIENYLGFPSGLSGADLARRAIVQAQRLGVESLSSQEVTGIRVEDPYRCVTLADGTEIGCYAVLIAVGIEWRQLDVPGISAISGLGVYYGSSMYEAVSCRGEEVYMVGGANSAGQAAMHFSKYARSVIMLVRGESLDKSMSQYLVDQISATDNITVRLRSSVVSVNGETSLQEITIADANTGEKQTVPATLLFILIGAIPHTDWLDGVVERDKKGFILSGPDLMRDSPSETLGERRRPRGWKLDRDPFLLETSVPGIFVAGDVRYGSVKRVASVVGEGAIAVQFIYQYLSNM